MITNTDMDRPDGPSIEQIASDLTLSNEEGTSWFGYGYDEQSDALKIEMYGDEGEILKTYTAILTITETTGK